MEEGRQNPGSDNTPEPNWAEKPENKTAAEAPAGDNTPEPQGPGNQSDNKPADDPQNNPYDGGQ